MKQPIITILLALVAISGQAQKVVLHKTGGQRIECSVSQLDSITFEDDGFIIVDEHEWVDLGLPSGTLWATCNVGANSPEEYGNYFAWGETEPKEEYIWETYTHCEGDYNVLTKYCIDNSYGYNGFTDGLTELLPEDDAATTNWGSGWKMPSLDQLSELINSTYTIRTLTEQNGVKGLQIKSRTNGESVFLPEAGFVQGRNPLAGFSGYYWSRSLGTRGYTDEGGLLSFYSYGSDDDSSNYIGTSCSVRYTGHSIRPVRVKTR